MATRTPFSEIDRIMKELQNPRDQKLILAQSITSLYHGAKKAAQAKENFIKQFTNKELPDHIEEKKISPPRTYKLSELLKLAGLAGSKGEARRLIEQKGVKVKGVVSTDVDIALDGKKEYLLQVGKRKFLKVK